LDIPLDLGPLTVPPGELKPGDPAPAFDVPTFGPERLCSRDYQGKVLLLGFYWSNLVAGHAPIVEDLKEAYQQFHSDPRYAQIGLLLARYLPWDKKVLEEAGLDWPHGLVTPRGKECTEYGVPETSALNVLIGPRGQVLGVGLSGVDLRQAIEQALHLP
jgi:peroxiredoxin